MEFELQPTSCGLALFMLFIKQEDSDAVNYKAITQAVTENLCHVAIATEPPQEQLTLIALLDTQMAPGDHLKVLPWLQQWHAPRAGLCLCRNLF
jgi:hypothetical protein